jgi:hypothetical protein
MRHLFYLVCPHDIKKSIVRETLYVQIESPYICTREISLTCSYEGFAQAGTTVVSSNWSWWCMLFSLFATYYISYPCWCTYHLVMSTLDPQVDINHAWIDRPSKHASAYYSLARRTWWSCACILSIHG